MFVYPNEPSARIDQLPRNLGWYVHRGGCVLSGMRRFPPLLVAGASLAVALALAAAGSLSVAAAPADAYYLNTSTDANPDNAHLNLLRFPPRNPGFRPCIQR